MAETVYFKCAYCQNKAYKGLTVFSPDLHFRMYHIAKILDKEVKESIKFISQDEYISSKASEQQEYEDLIQVQGQKFETVSAVPYPEDDGVI